MRHFFLVDYENVKEKGLEGFFNLKRRDTVYVFYSVNQQKISMEFIQTLRRGFFNPKIEYVYVKAGKQSLDMQLVSFLGYLISENGTLSCDYTIVSSDRDFLNVLDFWNERMGKTVVYEFPTIDRYLKKDTVVLLTAPKEEEKKESASSRRTVSSSTRTRTAAKTSSSSPARNSSSQPSRNSSPSQQSKYRELEKTAKTAAAGGNRKTERNTSAARAASDSPNETSALPVRVNTRQQNTAGKTAMSPAKTSDAEKKERDAVSLSPLPEDTVKNAAAGESEAEEKKAALEEKAVRETEQTEAVETKGEKAESDTDTALPDEAGENPGEEEPSGKADTAEEPKEEKKAPARKMTVAKNASAAKATATKKEETVSLKEETGENTPAKPAQSEKTVLNNRLQQVLAKAQVDTKIISEITHLVLEHMDEKNFRQIVYREMIKKYRQADGLKYYNIIKPVL